MHNNVTYIFVSNEKYDREIRHLTKQVGRYGGPILMLTLVTGLLLSMSLVQQKRLDELEAQIQQQEKAE